MGNYDRIIKENIEAIFLALLEKFTGIKIIRCTQIKDKIQHTLEREPDFLKKVIDQSGNEFILHMEFQTQDDPEMVYRMAEYKALLQRKYKLSVKQFVIYLGMKAPTMRTQLTQDEKITGFALQNIHDFDPHTLTKSKIPEEIILAILSNYAEDEVDEVIASIVLKLQALAKGEVELNKYLKQLMILGRLRKLEKRISKKVEDMPITYDITTDGLYKQGIERGIEQNKFESISNLVRQGLLTNKQIAEAMNVELSIVNEIKAKLTNRKYTILSKPDHFL
ncbi:MAG: hypothetical protein AAF620_15610 [Bacteroidota bacterium]